MIERDHESVWLTVKQFAVAANVSTQAIYKRLATESTTLQPYCKRINGRKYINSAALSVFGVVNQLQPNATKVAPHLQPLATEVATQLQPNATEVATSCNQLQPNATEVATQLQPNATSCNQLQPNATKVAPHLQQPVATKRNRSCNPVATRYSRGWQPVATSCDGRNSGN